VLLMLENRSFDHMLGYLPHPDRDFNGLRNGVYVNMSSGPDGLVPIPVSDTGTPDLVDPDHSHMGVVEQLEGFGGVEINGGFVKNYAEFRDDPAVGPLVMQCLNPQSACPILAELALQFAVCHAWNCSVQGETWPNRNFAHAATSDGEADIDFGFYYDKTIFEQLASAKATWRIYHDGPAQAWFFRKLWRRRTIIDFLLNRTPKIGNWYEQADFYEHVTNHCLPSYSFIEPAHMTLGSDIGDPRQTNSQHPHNNARNADDFYAGETLIKNIFEALASEPDVFAKTLFLITYDEHGGLYDHMPPPPAKPPGDPVWRGPTRWIAGIIRNMVGGLQGRPRAMPCDFKHRGVRVPAVLISPWIRPGTLVNKDLEHASIPKTLRALFAPGLPPLTHRDGDKDLNTFLDVVTNDPLPTPRRRPGDPDGDSQYALPDLSALAPALHRPVGRDVVAPTLATPEPSRVDEQLLALSNRVSDKLSSKPVIVARALQRRTRRLRAQPWELDALTGDHRSAVTAAATFAKAARQARVQPARRRLLAARLVRRKGGSDAPR
jgi:phospholipase C